MKKLSTLAIMVFALVLLTSAGIIAQNTVSGVVTDDTGEPLIGANVLEQGTSNGTITDLDGSYSLSVPDGATLVFSFTGFTDQVLAVGNQSTINVQLATGALLDEVVVVGYGSQNKKEITSSVVQLGEEDFNQGAISNAAELLQGKVAGLQVYNRNGDPNGERTILVRGISTVGANVEPLIVIDGVIGASLDNVDPNDIESVNVLKDGSAAAIYGSRGSSGVIIVTTKTGSFESNETSMSYNGQISTASPFNSVNVLDGPEFVAAGGTNLGSNTNWTDEITRNGFTNNQGLSISGGSGNTTYRVSGNYRKSDGILVNSGFESFNGRLNLSTRALNDKLKINVTTSFTDRNQENGFEEALRYAVLYNPTAPVFGVDAPFQFNSEQFGGYFQTLGLFDSFNPVSIAEQNRNVTDRKQLNYGATFNYNFLENLTGTFQMSYENIAEDNRLYYPTTALFRGGADSPIRKGLANFSDFFRDFKLYEGYLTWVKDFSNTNLTLTGGYSFQQTNERGSGFSLGDFPSNDIDFSNLISVSQDLQNSGLIGAGSGASPDQKIIAFFGRANVTIGNSLFLNASLRREGSTALGAENRWGFFPAFGIGTDLAKVANIGGLNNLKVRFGYGVTGALPPTYGLSQSTRGINNGTDGSVTTVPAVAGNPNLKWEEKAEFNFGIEASTDRLSATLELYRREVEDFISLVALDQSLGMGSSQWQNAGKLSTNGIELSLNYDVVKNSKVSYNTGVVFSSYSVTLDSLNAPAGVRGNLGSPGQNGTNMVLVEQGRTIGDIWGPVFEGVAEDGSPIMADLNGDGELLTAQDQALEPDGDFAVLGNGIPDFEIGWTNQVTIGDWSINAFFRGAFGHSLVNTFRAFYEPRIASQSSYNYVTSSKAVDGLTSAQFSSLYVEKADFFKLDNLTVGRRFTLGENSPFRNLQLSLNVRNPFVITGYTGTNPEPSLSDVGSASNGATAPFQDNPDVLVPGIDRRTNYFSSREVTFSVNVNF